MAIINCPTNCASLLPPVKFSKCAPNVVSSEIRHIIIGRLEAEPFTNWALKAEWDARLSETSTDPNALRLLTVRGNKPAAASVVAEVSDWRRKNLGKDHTINFIVDDVTDENYEFMRAMECGGEFRFWYTTHGGYTYGGNEGFIGELDYNDQLDEGREAFEQLVGVITGRSKFSPERIKQPYDDPGTAPLTFDTTLSFASSTSATAEGVNATALATNATEKFEFNAIESPIGTPSNMNVEVGGGLVLVVTFPSDYVGSTFRYTSATNVVYVSTFINGDREL